MTSLLLLTAGASAFTAEQPALTVSEIPGLPEPGDETQIVVPPCLPAELPMAVDECGDTMTGNLAFNAGLGVLLGGGLLGASGTTLTFRGTPVCVANAPLSGCGTGDITSVIAGSGLQGGGAAGDVSLSVNPAATQTRVAGSCAVGNAIRAVNQDGTVACEADDNSGGTVTSVASGAGLAGGPITSAGTLSIAVGGVTSAMVADGTLGAADVDAAAIQRRVASACATGQAIRGVNSDGTVTCEVDDNSGGTVTSVASGAGLTGGPITGSGTLSIATGGVTGAMINTGTTITAAGFSYNAAKAGRVFQHPLDCVRSSSGNGNAPFLDLDVYAPPMNAFAGFSTSPAAAAGLYNLYCPVTLQLPPGGSATITGVTFGHGDYSASCLVGAEVRHRTVWAPNFGTSVGTEYSGAGSADYASTVGAPTGKAIPITSFTATQDTDIWLRVFIDQTLAGADCRYHGAKIDYTVTQV